jgi:anti-sigma factor RsiW
MSEQRNSNPELFVGKTDSNPTEPFMDPLSHHLDTHALQALASGELPPQEAMDAHAHLDGCSLCREDFTSWKLLVKNLESLPELGTRAAFEDAILARVLPSTPAKAALRHLTSQGIQRHLMGELDPEQSAGVLVHLAQCTACRKEASVWHGLFAKLGTLPSPLPSLGFEDAVMARVPVEAIARVVAAERRPWHQRVQERVAGWVPRTRRGWVLWGGASVLPATGPILALVLFLTNPALTLRDILVFTQWQLLRMGEGLGALWLKIPGSVAITRILEGVPQVLQRIPPEGLLLAFVLSSLVIAASALILIRSLLLPISHRRSHAP